MVRRLVPLYFPAARFPETFMSTTAPAAKPIPWRTPIVILVCGCLIGVLSFGPRSALGFFLTPMSQANGWGREVFSLALALQSLLWGATQPFAGALADMFGIVRVMWFGAILYAAGLVLMAFSTTPGELYFSAGVLIGIGVASCSFSLVIASFGKLLPPEKRALGFGLGTAAGSFGQFLFSPLAVGLQQAYGWQTALFIFAATLCMVMPLAIALATPRLSDATGAFAELSLRQQLRQAVGHRSYQLLVVGFFTCGFQLQFITAHLPAYLLDLGLSAEIGGWTMAVIGLFNIVGAVTAGWLSGWMPKRYLLAIIYFVRSLAILGFIMIPITPASTLIFGAVMGLMWLSTVPPTSGLVLVMFGTRWLAMLSGMVFFSHQFGSFLGVWLGGIVFERTGAYDLIWWLSILFGVLSALINLPIVEKPAPQRMAAATA